MLYKCSYCESSSSTKEKAEYHEGVCIKNGKTDEERFKFRINWETRKIKNESRN